MSPTKVALVAVIAGLLAVSGLGLSLYVSSNGSVSNLNNEVQALMNGNANLIQRVDVLGNQTSRLESLLNLSEIGPSFHDNLSNLTSGQELLFQFNATYPGYLEVSGATSGDIISHIDVYNSFTGRNDSVEVFGPIHFVAAVLPGTVKVFLQWQGYGDLPLLGEVNVNATYHT